jgi:hypothetical protein
MASQDSTFAPNETGPERIDVGSDGTLQTWAKRLNVSSDQIREAVEKVGDLASDVELHLKGSRSTTNDDRVEAAK